MIDLRHFDAIRAKIPAVTNARIRRSACPHRRRRGDRLHLPTRPRVATIGKERVGIRLSPYGVNGGMAPDAETDALYSYLARKLAELGLVYIHVVDHSPMGAPPVKPELKATIRKEFSGAYILSGGYDGARAEADLAEKKGDLVAFGRPFLANPDLVQKLQSKAAVLPPDPSTFFTPDMMGYLEL